MISVETPTSFELFRREARRLLAANVPPQEVAWSGQQGTLFSGQVPSPVPEQNPVREQSIPPPLTLRAADLRLLELVALHADPDRWNLLYHILWRIKIEHPQLLRNPTDVQVLQAERMAKQVSRDIHKMHAFVRFKKVSAGARERFVAWYEPDHHIVRAASRFFRERFKQMAWSILTPEQCVHWDGSALEFSPGLTAKPDALGEDPIEAWWKTYYGSIFNPARVKTKMMKREMPVRFWRNLPEAEIIPDLLAQAPIRQQEMRSSLTAAAQPPRTGSLDDLMRAARSCSACPIAQCATRTVFGEGAARARLMIIGEQPGDEEDTAGRPFVGPAGQLLDELLAQAGVARNELYITNAVKHFKFEWRGKRRLHQRPNGREVLACRPWLLAELATVDPGVIVCLGATAAQAIFGKNVKVTKFSKEGAPWNVGGNVRQVFVTYHPAAALRALDEEHRDTILQAIRTTVGHAARLCAAGPRPTLGSV